jgi:hypothetical protein
VTGVRDDSPWPCPLTLSMANFRFETLPRLICADGESERLGGLMREFGITRPLVVTDRGIVDAGLVDAGTPLVLRAPGVSPTRTRRQFPANDNLQTSPPPTRARSRDRPSRSGVERPYSSDLGLWHVAPRIIDAHKACTQFAGMTLPPPDGGTETPSRARPRRQAEHAPCADPVPAVGARPTP